MNTNKPTAAETEILRKKIQERRARTEQHLQKRTAEALREKRLAAVAAEVNRGALLDAVARTASDLSTLGVTPQQLGSSIAAFSKRR
ncbi:MAG TPA: hypothetical protein VFY57_00615 [Rubrobacteraceae bacterium]|nr:hypothetical protein [Rubrobacteraceae bacterium]